jgi:hypothetical protein
MTEDGPPYLPGVKSERPASVPSPPLLERANARCVSHFDPRAIDANHQRPNRITTSVSALDAEADVVARQDARVRRFVLRERSCGHRREHRHHRDHKHDQSPHGSLQSISPHTATHDPCRRRLNACSRFSIRDLSVRVSAWRRLRPKDL